MINSSLVFITGISGFVGQNLKSYLAKNFQILGISRMKTGNSLNYENFFREKPDYKAIIHLAGKAHDLKKVSQPQEYYVANFELTKQLFDAFLHSKSSIFIFISTVKAAADDLEEVVTEATVSSPKTHYGISKLQAENYILSQPLSEGKRIYIIRPCMIHGPGNKGNLNLLFKLVSKNIPWPLGAFENKRSFCSIDNLMFIIKELIEREDIPSGIYNIADDEPLSTNELINLIAQSQKIKSNIWKIPKALIERLTKLGDLLHLPLNSESLQKLTDSYIVSNKKIKDAIGKPLPVSSIDGLLNTFASFSKN